MSVIAILVLAALLAVRMFASAEFSQPAIVRILAQAFRGGVPLTLALVLTGCGVVGEVYIYPISLGGPPLTMQSNIPRLVAYEGVETAPIEQATAVCEGEAEYFQDMPPNIECYTEQPVRSWQTRETNCTVSPVSPRKRFSSDKFVSCLARYGWKFDPREEDKIIEAALADAVRVNNASFLDKLLEERIQANEDSEDGGFELNLGNEDGQTLMHYAAHFDATDSVKVLLKHGANIHAVDNWNQTALHVAAHQNAINAAKTLLDNGARVNAQSFSRGITPLHIAAGSGLMEMAELLVNRGADLHAQMDRLNTSPAAVAARNQRFKMAAWLAGLE